MVDRLRYKPIIFNAFLNRIRFGLICLFMIAWSLVVHSQLYIYTSNSFWETNFEIDHTCGCDINLYCQGDGGFGHSVSCAPDNGLVYQGTHPTMAAWDPITCDSETLYGIPDTFPQTVGLVAIGGGLFYTMDDPTVGSKLYIWNINNFTLTTVGSTGYPSLRDLCHYNGKFYHLTLDGVVQIDTANPQNSILIPTEAPLNHHHMLTASPFCNSLLTFAYNTDPDVLDSFVLINVLDGTITGPICTFYDWQVFGIVSPLEYVNPAPCELWMDLDCDDSDSWSYFDCTTLDGVPVTDDDIRIFADTHLDYMTITITDPIPDDPDEILSIIGPLINISESGSGTSTITLINDGSTAIYNFRNALKQIVYQNLAVQPTPGVRTIEVQFVTQSGAVSNISEFYVDVEEFILTEVDLGPDQEACDGATFTFDAGNPGAIYAWSTGETSQTISVDQSGQYIVTVNDGINCPGTDTVLVDLFPNINVSLIGDDYICENESANLILTTDSPFPLDIEIQINPGSPFFFTDVTGTFTFTDFPAETTTYTITNITSSQSFCFDPTDLEQIVEVFPTYNLEVDTALCDGDSLWLGYFWETDPGTYENLLETTTGCDSFVVTTITVLPAVHLFFTSATCDSSIAGIFYQYLPNANGCDTIVETTVTLLPSDTTYLAAASCQFSQVGIRYDTATGTSGCDSLIITTISYIPPADTTFVFAESCDSTQVGVINNLVTGSDGCDSLIITTVSLIPSDTTYLFAESCDSAQVGIITHVEIGVDGCDSLVITTVNFGIPDTTFLSGTSCDSSSLGTFITHFTSSNQCDSTVITTISFSAQDSVFISSASCDINDVGVFVSQYTNQFGCDSIVTENVSLLPSDASTIQSTTCDPASAGVFVTMLVNQFGCDSIVTETVALLPSDALLLFSSTCQASEAGVFVTTLVNQYGCDSIVTETVTLLLLDTTYLFAGSCDPSQVGMTHHTISGSDGCDSIIIETTELFPLPALDIVSAIDYNGYGVSCAGATDGGIIAQANGIAPFHYQWYTGDTTIDLTNIGSGIYSITLTDANLCTVDDSIVLSGPDTFHIGFIVSEPDCFGIQEGSVSVQPSGGVSPFTYSIDGTNFQTSPDFTNLGEGVYQLTALDANDCEATELIWINVPLQVMVSLGDDQVISRGDTTILQAIVNVPIDSLSSIIWSGLENNTCPECLTQLVAPFITTSYSITLTSIGGCTDKDSMQVSVITDHNLYVPNIFSPNGDNINDLLVINTSNDIEEIESFEIFDRWGNLVFAASHVQANDPSVSWDGKRNGKTLNPGVFAYKLKVRFSDGTTEVRYGDITLIR